MPDGEMKPESLNVNREPLTGAPALGASHAENAGEFHQPTWAEENPAAAAAALIRASAAGRVELSPTVGVPDPIEDYFAKMATPEGLRKLQEFLARPDVVSWDEDKVVPIKNTPGLPLGEMKRVVAAIQAGQGRGKSVEQLVREARQQRQYDPPEQIPAAGRGVSRKETARQHWQAQIIRTNVSTEQLLSWRNNIGVARKDPMDSTDWPSWIQQYAEWKVLPDRLLLDLDREILIRTMRRYGVSHGEELLSNQRFGQLNKDNPVVVEPVLRALLEEFRKADMMGEIPLMRQGEQEILSPDLDFGEKFNKLRLLMEAQRVQPNGVSKQEDREKILGQLKQFIPPAEVEQFQKVAEQLRLAAMPPEMGLDVMQMTTALGRDVAAYVFEPEIDRVLRLAEDLTQEQRNQWVARAAGTTLRAGRASSRTGLYLAALGGDENASSIESAIGKGPEFVEKIMHLAGYIKPEQLHQAAGFFPPEQIGAMLETPIRFAAWIRDPESGEKLKKIIEINPKDVLASFYNTEAMRELLANQAYGTKGYWEARGRWFSYTFWRRAGYSEDEARRFAYDPKTAPEIVWTNQLSMTTRRNIDSLGIWMGENWWMVMEAEAIFMFSRSDYAIFPIDEFARRWFLALRAVEQGDYSRLYDLGAPFLQTFGGIAYLPEYFSLIAKDALLDPLLVDALVNFNDRRLNRRDNEDDIEVYGFREKALSRLVLIDQPTPAVVKELAKMALGLDEYKPEGGTAEEKLRSWQKKVADGMKVIDKTMIKRLRLPEFWRDVTATHLGMTQAQLERAWRDFDFSSWLKQSGLLDEEIARGPTRGVGGWERFKRSASLRLMHFALDERGAAQYRDGDKNIRYLAKLSTTEEVIEKLFRLSLEGPELEPHTVGGHKMQARGHDARQIILEKITSFKEKLLGAGREMVVGDFIPNDASQRMYRAILQGFRDTYCAWDLDRALVEAVEPGKVGAGTTFSLRRINKKIFDNRWLPVLGGDNQLVNQVIRFLRGYQMYFAETVEMEAQRQAELELPEKERESFPILLGPHTGFVPDVVTPRQLLGELQDATNEEIRKMEEELVPQLRQRSPNYQGLLLFRTQLKQLLSENAFCWMRLRDGSWALEPYLIENLVRAVDTTANLARAISDPVMSETENLVKSRKLKPHMIADNRWRHQTVPTNILTRLWEVGPYSGPPTDYKIWQE